MKDNNPLRHCPPTRQHRWLWIPFLCVVFATGCLSERPTPGTEDERLVVSVDKAIHTIDPRFTYDTTSMKISQMVFSALTTVDNQSLEPRFELASDIQLDPQNPRLWHVYLRKDVQFHDGRPLTGEDVAYTFRSVLDPSFGSPFHGDFSAKIASVDVDPTDPHHVLFTVHKPYATFLTDLVLGIVPAWLADKPKGLFPSGTYVGTGGFRFVEQSHNRRIILERNEKWHHPTPSYRWLVFKTIPDESTRLLSILGGSSDLLLNGISPILLDVLSGHEGIRVESAPSIVFTYMGFNLRQPQLADPRVRKAIALSIDREKIIHRRFMGKATPATSMLPALHWAHNRDIPLLKTDLEQARKLLDEAGLSPDPKTGIRLEIELKISTDRFRRSIAKMMAHQLAQVGIHLKIRSYEFSTFFSDVRKGNFDLFMLQLPAPIEPDMHRWMFYSLNTPETGPFSGSSPYAQADRSAFHPHLDRLKEDPVCQQWAAEAHEAGIKRKASGTKPDLGIANRTYYANPKVDCLVDLGMLETDREKRKALYATVQEILAEELPIIPLWHEDNIVVLRDKVRRFDLLPNASFANLPKAKLGP